MKCHLLIFILLFPFIQLAAQKSGAIVTGKILDENEKPLARVSIVLLGRETGLVSSDSGTFRMRVPADKAFALVFSFTGFKSLQQNFILNDKEEEHVVIRMERSVTNLEHVTVTDDRDRREAGLVHINPN
jgi:hypothetical protein